MSSAPKKLGRPTTYMDVYPELILELSSAGALNCDLYVSLDICKETFFQWVNAYPEFEDAYRRARARSEAYWARQLKEMTLAKDDKGAKACIMILNNNFGWGNNEARGSTTNHIQIGNMNVLSTKSEVELLEIIQEKMKKLHIQDVPFLEIKNDPTE